MRNIKCGLAIELGRSHLSELKNPNYGDGILMNLFRIHMAMTSLVSTCLEVANGLQKNCWPLPSCHGYRSGYFSMNHGW